MVFRFGSVDAERVVFWHALICSDSLRFLPMCSDPFASPSNPSFFGKKTRVFPQKSKVEKKGKMPQKSKTGKQRKQGNRKKKARIGGSGFSFFPKQVLRALQLKDKRPLVFRCFPSFLSKKSKVGESGGVEKASNLTGF